MQNDYKQANAVLFISTLAYTACFAVWTLFAVVGVPMQSALALNGLEFGFLLSIPILSGSLMRFPVAQFGDYVGVRTALTCLMLSVAIPLYLLPFATTYAELLLLGFFLGVSGASFVVAASYISQSFPQGRRGVAIGRFGAGSIGAALTVALCPLLLVEGSWQLASNTYAVLIVTFAVIFWVFSPRLARQDYAQRISIRDQLKLIRDPKIWKYCQYYSLVFGGFVGLTLWLTSYYINEYQLDIVTAGLLTALFVTPFAFMQLFGARLLNRFSAYVVTWGVLWLSWVVLFLLSYPQASVSVDTVTGDAWQFAVAIDISLFVVLSMLLGSAWGLGKASVLKALSEDYRENFGVASSVVGMAGGLGGFLSPVLFGWLLDVTRVNASVFILLYGATSVSLVLMYFTFGRDHEAEVIQEAKDTAIGDAQLSSMSSVVNKQRQAIASTLSQALAKCARRLSSVLADQEALEDYLSKFQLKLEHYKFIYVMDADGVQVTANLSQHGREESHLGRDRSSRPYMVNMFGDVDFELSESYISRNNKRPSLTAIHVIRNSEGTRIGFLGVDYDLRSLPREGAVYQGTKEWRQMKGDPSIRGGLFAQERTQSVMDNHMDDVLALLEELLLEHGVYQGKLHFSSSRATLWHIDDPYSYHLLSTDELIDPDICLAYPRQPYHKKTTVPKADIAKVFAQFRELRFADETIYLRAGSLNTINGMVALNFSCDGSHYLRYDEFLGKGMDFWFGG